MVHTMKDQMGASRRTRRPHERKFKDDLIAQSLMPGASVAAIAMKGGVNANLLFKWRREHVKAKVAAVSAPANLLPVCVVPDVGSNPTSVPTTTVDPSGARVSRSARPGVIEVEIAGAQLRLRGAVDEAMLGSVLRALRQST
jgi:transposase